MRKLGQHRLPRHTHHDQFTRWRGFQAECEALIDREHTAGPDAGAGSMLADDEFPRQLDRHRKGRSRTDRVRRRVTQLDRRRLDIGERTRPQRQVLEDARRRPGGETIERQPGEHLECVAVPPGPTFHGLDGIEVQ